MDIKSQTLEDANHPVRIEHIIPDETDLRRAPQQSYECDICGQNVKTKSNLRAHRVKTHRIVETDSDVAFLYRTKRDVKRLFHCPVNGCKYQESMRGFSKLSALRQHYMWVHGSREHMCSNCFRLFPSLKLMERHRVTCGQFHVCLKCGRRYSELKYLRQHMKRMKHTSNEITHVPNLKSESPMIVDDVVNIAPTPSTSSDQSAGFLSINTAETSASNIVHTLQPIVLPVIVPYPVSMNGLKSQPISLDSSAIAEAVATAIRPIIERMSVETATQTSPQIPQEAPSITHVTIPTALANNGLDYKKMTVNVASETFVNLPTNLTHTNVALGTDINPLFQPACSQTEDLFDASYDRPCLHVETQTCEPRVDLLTGAPSRNLQTPQPPMVATQTLVTTNAAAEYLSNMETQTDPIDAWIEAELSDIETQTSSYDLDSLLAVTCSQTQTNM